MPVLSHWGNGLHLEMVGPSQKLAAFRNNHTAFSGGDGLVAEKAEGRHISECPDMSAFVVGAESLGAIFDQIEVELPADVDHFVHVTRVPIQVHDHQRLGARCDFPPNVFQINLPCCRERLGENRRCFSLNDGIDGGHVGQCWNDYFIA